MNISRMIKNTGNNCTLRFVETDAAGNCVFNTSFDNVYVKPYGKYDKGYYFKAAVCKPRFNELFNELGKQEAERLVNGYDAVVQLEKDGMILEFNYSWMSLDAEDVFVAQPYREILIYVKENTAVSVRNMQPAENLAAAI